MTRRCLRFILLMSYCCANPAILWAACIDSLRAGGFVLAINDEVHPEAHLSDEIYKGSLRVDIRQTDERPLEISIVQYTQLSDQDVALRMSPLMDLLIRFIQKPDQLTFSPAGTLRVTQNLEFADQPLVAVGIDLSNLSRETIRFRSFSAVKFQVVQNLKGLNPGQNFYRVHGREMTDITFWFSGDMKIFGKSKSVRGKVRDLNLEMPL